ncbi:MAG TPA: TetR family transcriptional regulator [Mycobacteriales bacterium]|jgi:AcrR family transcriptional regulator|nr:TetR family transcriptional regulator [Mycobacteriales bacterium]
MVRPASFAERGRVQLRGELLQAMYEVVVAGNYATTSMAAIAARVGVSRQTLYNEFKSREGLVAALVHQENTAILAEVAATLERHPGDLSGGVAAAIETVLRRAADDPLTKALLGGDPGLLPVFTTEAEPLLEHSRTALTAYALTHYPALDAEDAAALTDAVVRLAHSHIVVPHDPPDQVAARIARLVARFIQGGHA